MLISRVRSTLNYRKQRHPDASSHPSPQPFATTAEWPSWRAWLKPKLRWRTETSPEAKPGPGRPGTAPGPPTSSTGLSKIGSTKRFSSWRFSRRRDSQVQRVEDLGSGILSSSVKFIPQSSHVVVLEREPAPIVSGTHLPGAYSRIRHSAYYDLGDVQPTARRCVREHVPRRSATLLGPRTAKLQKEEDSGQMALGRTQSLRQPIAATTATTQSVSRLQQRRLPTSGQLATAASLVAALPPHQTPSASDQSAAAIPVPRSRQSSVLTNRQPTPALDSPPPYRLTGVDHEQPLVRRHTYHRGRLVNPCPTVDRLVDAKTPVRVDCGLSAGQSDDNVPIAQICRLGRSATLGAIGSNHPRPYLGQRTAPLDLAITIPTRPPRVSADYNWLQETFADDLQDPLSTASWVLSASREMHVSPLARPPCQASYTSSLVVDPSSAVVDSRNSDIRDSDDEDDDTAPIMQALPPISSRLSPTDVLETNHEKIAVMDSPPPSPFVEQLIVKLDHLAQQPPVDLEHPRHWQQYPLRHRGAQSHAYDQQTIQLGQWRHTVIAATGDGPPDLYPPCFGACLVPSPYTPPVTEEDNIPLIFVQRASVRSVVATGVTSTNHDTCTCTQLARPAPVAPRRSTCRMIHVDPSGARPVVTVTSSDSDSESF
ncbi:hypothetical protein IWQ60_003066 [Tieghemiomyces parasiticus]|uniref:Uncharacterized protein n=1 Tax=Tieghemiomyces parasiticus TaxID=78921 RepID=A0A9W8AE05_9FUNG|nr:hypothetical protein IWQ60_003066 [Tieghemiomyces parasiticus]